MYKIMKNIKQPATLLLRYAMHHADNHTGNDLRKWLSFYKVLRSFEIHSAKTLYSNSFDKPLLDSFFRYLAIEKKYAMNTIKGMWNNLRALLNDAGRNGYAVDRDAMKQVRLKQNEPIAIYLTQDEIFKIASFDLGGRFEKVRDLFVIGCYTGLRFSDLININSTHIKGNSFQILTRKTSERVVIPIHPIVREIIKRYGDDFKFEFTQSWYNETIKHIARDAGIDDDITIERRAGDGLVETKIVPKWKLISSHTGRRSFATNLYLSKTNSPVYHIMLITGHKTEESFFRYIRISKEENAKQLLKHPFYAERGQ